MTLSKQAEALERIKEKCKENLLAFAIATDRNFEPFWHHKVIAEKLEQVERGEIKRLIITLPPRHGKSYLSTEKFPVWYLGKHPEREVGVIAYSAELAETFGYKSRDIAMGEQARAIFNLKLRADSQAKDHWMTEQGGGYSAIGFGGSMTGRGFHLIIIDDPIKNNEEAESQSFRDKQMVFYQATLYTRLYKDAAIVLIQCMTGDTPVLMSNGIEKPLRDIRPGDMVATYKNGSLTMAKVKNWTSNGIDNVFAIKTISGRVVKANGRHPFLISIDGKPEWIRTKNLRPGQEIFRVNGESGKTKHVYGKAVNFQSLVEDTATPTTQRSVGQTVSDLHQSIRNLFGRGISNTVTELLWKIIIACFPNKMENVQYAGNSQEKMFVPIGAENSALTTTTKQKKSGGFSVMTATLLSGMRKLLRLLSPRQNISDFTLDKIVEITPAGVEEVFDVEIEGTENFIANGLVSHNTRWHLDDLAGRLQEEEKNGGDHWEVLNIPAIADTDETYDIKGVPFIRKAGEVIEEKLFSKEEILQKKNVLGSFYFSALYQGQPISSENQEFRKEFFKYIDFDEVTKISTRRFMTIDTAISKKASGDDTGITLNFVNKENHWHFMTWKLKVSPQELMDFIFQKWEQYRVEQIGIEKTIYLQAVKPFFDEEMRKRNKFPYVTELQHNQINKEVRIRGLLPYYESGSIFHIRGHCDGLEEQLLTFPKGRRDDVIDSAAYQTQIVKKPYDSHEKKIHRFRYASLD